MVVGIIIIEVIKVENLTKFKVFGNEKERMCVQPYDKLVTRVVLGKSREKAKKKMKVEYLSDEEKREKYVENMFMNFFNEYYFLSIFKIQWKMKERLILPSFAKIYFHNDSVSITINKKWFEKLKDRFEKFEKKVRIPLYIEVR